MAWRSACCMAGLLAMTRFDSTISMRISCISFLARSRIASCSSRSRCSDSISVTSRSLTTTRISSPASSRTGTPVRTSFRPRRDCSMLTGFPVRSTSSVAERSNTPSSISAFMLRPTTWAGSMELRRAEAGLMRRTLASPSQTQSPSDIELMIASSSLASSSPARMRRSTSSRSAPSTSTQKTPPTPSGPRMGARRASRLSGPRRTATWSPGGSPRRARARSPDSSGAAEVSGRPGTRERASAAGPPANRIRPSVPAMAMPRRGPKMSARANDSASSPDSASQLTRERPGSALRIIGDLCHRA